MDTKKCIKCGKELPHSSFYPHSQMPDGYLNKCKECFKAEMRERYNRKSQDPEWVEKERTRGREKYRRLGYANKTSESKRVKESKFKGLRTTKRAVKNISIEDGYELHHWNYNLMHNVIVLDKRLHHRLHSVIELNMEEGIYYHKGEKLDTIEKHLKVIKNVCEERGFRYSDIILIYKLSA